MGCGSGKPSNQIVDHQSKKNIVVPDQKHSENADQKSSEDKKLSEEKKDQTNAKDIMGRTIDANLNLEVELSINDMAMNAMSLIKTIMFLIESSMRRNQILKAVLRRMHSLDATFTELQKNSFKFSKEGITNLIYVINTIKEYCVKITKEPKSIFDHAKKFLSANSQLKELANFDEILTKSLDDLKVPLTLEEINLQKQTMDQLKELTDRVVETLKNVEGNGVKVVGLAKKNLSNEEAFAFWIECFPEKYLVSAKEFSTIFQDYLSSYKGVELKKTHIDLILKLINDCPDETESEIMISAKELNTFFENLPLNVEWDKLDFIQKQVESDQKKRVDDVVEKRKVNEVQIQQKVEDIKNQETKEEKDLITQGNYTRFFVKEAWILESQEKIELKFRNVFIMPKNGKILAFGNDKKNGEFRMSGDMDFSGKFTLKKIYLKNNETVEIFGNLGIYNNTLDGTLSFCGKSSEGKVVISLDVDHWFGYYLQNGDPTDMQVCFKTVKKNMIGISLDEIGAAIWNGSLRETELHMMKQYIQQHSVKYDGKIGKKGVVTEIKGKWEIKGTTDGFFLSHNDEEDD